jgi:uncharacterized membrane protein
MEREEPPLQAEIMMRSSMTLSLILLGLPQLGSFATYLVSNVLCAPTLHDKDILLPDRRFWIAGQPSTLALVVV